MTLSDTLHEGMTHMFISIHISQRLIDLICLVFLRYNWPDILERTFRFFVDV